MRVQGHRHARRKGSQPVLKNDRQEIPLPSWNKGSPSVTLYDIYLG